MSNHQRPLSETKRGIMLSVIGGVPCGPAGLIVSPLVLLFLRKWKKTGNRFLIWSLIGIPAFASLWFVQVMTIVFLFGMEPPKHDYRSNGMNEWKKVADSTDSMNNPDWCIHETKFTGFDAYEVLECYKKLQYDGSQEYARVECIMEPELGIMQYQCKQVENELVSDGDAKRFLNDFGK